MANIVELREMSDDKLEELLENAREEMFNLRFQKATAQLDNYARIKAVRREIAQYETVLRMRQLATDTAVSQPEVSKALANKAWKANARYVYEDGAWQVQFSDEKGKELASATVNLNKKRPQTRSARTTQPQPEMVLSYEIAG